MKHVLIFIIAFFIITKDAKARKFYITATFHSQCPITIKTSDATYILHKADKYAKSGDGVVIIYTNGNSPLAFTAYNKDGDWITQYSESNKTDSNGNIEYTRIILGGTGYTWSSRNKSTENNDSNWETVPGQETSSNSDSFNSNYGNVSTRQYIAEEVISTGEQAVNRFSDIARRGMYVYVDGYPNVQISAGISRAYGEFIRFKWCFGGIGGSVMYGGIGKDLLFNGENKDRLSWHIAVGYFISTGYDNNQDLTIGFSVGETPVMKNGTINTDLTYSYFFGNRKLYGFFAGAAIGVGNLKETFKARSEYEPFPGKFVWDLHIGVSIKLWQR